MITVFGSINMDLVATATTMPRPGQTVAGLHSSVAPGGKGANQALAARRAGADVRMAGAVGHDHFAADALALLKEASIDLSLVRVVDRPTGTAHVVVDGSGENAIVIVPGANGEVRPQDADGVLGDMKSGEFLILQMEISVAAVEAAIMAAKGRGVVSVLNVAPMSAEAARLSAAADIIVANEIEFEMLVGRSSLFGELRVSALRDLHSRSGQTLVVTLGAEGAIAIHEGLIYSAEGLGIVPIDTVGAGDTFCGYLVASLDARHEFGQALQRATVAGSLACTKAGAQPSIPVGTEVQRHLRG